MPAGSPKGWPRSPRHVGWCATPVEQGTGPGGVPGPGPLATTGVEPVCGPECAEVRYFREEAVPWEELAYPDIGNYLRMHFRERRCGERTIHFSRLDAVAVISSAYSISAIGETKRVREALTPLKREQ